MFATRLPFKATSEISIFSMIWNNRFLYQSLYQSLIKSAKKNLAKGVALNHLGTTIKGNVLNPPK